MPQQNSILAAAAVMALMPLLTLNAMAREPGPPIQLAMMDMMPMGSGAQQAPPGGAAMPGMPGPQTGTPAQGGMMDDDKMRMGGMAGQGQAQSQTQMGGAPGQGRAGPWGQGWEGSGGDQLEVAADREGVRGPTPQLHHVLPTMALGLHDVEFPRAAISSGAVGRGSVVAGHAA